VIVGGPRKVNKNPNPAVSCEGEYWDQEGQDRAAARAALLEQQRQQAAQADEGQSK
jgi:hypothetical protein